MRLIYQIFIYYMINAVFGQSRTEITPISGTIQGSIKNTVEDLNPNAPILYSFHIPEDASKVRFALTNDNPSKCDSINGYIMQDIPPCTNGSFNGYTTFCDFGYSRSLKSSDSTSELFISPGFYYNYLSWKLDTTVYIGVATDNPYYGSTCSYTLTVQVISSCSAGSVAIYNYTSDNGQHLSCVSFIDVPSAKDYFYSVEDVNDLSYNAN